MFEGREFLLLEKLSIGRPFIIKKNEYTDKARLSEKLKVGKELGFNYAVVEMGECKVLDVGRSVEEGKAHEVSYRRVRNSEDYSTLLKILLGGSGSVALVVDEHNNVKALFSREDLGKHTFFARLYSSLMRLECVAYYYVTEFRASGERDCLVYYNTKFDRKGEKLSKVEDVGIQPLLEFIGSVILLERKELVEYEFFRDIGSLGYNISRVHQLRNSVAHVKLLGERRLVIDRGLVNDLELAESAYRDLHSVMGGEKRFLTWFEKHFTA
ncbi:MAG: hypothetical protein ACKOW9_03080 [Candidatus Paceibacterota bacterium]